MALDWKNLSPLLVHPATGKLVTAVNLTLVTLLAYSLAGVTWQALPAPSQPPPHPPPGWAGIPAQSASLPGAASARRIADWHLFGNAHEAQGDVPPQETLPETKLNLVLRGVLAINDKRRAQAIIAQPSGQEQAYGIGDTLPGGAILQQIKPTSVILLRNNQYETLSLPKLALNGAQSAESATAGDDSAAAVPSLREVRDKLLTNPESLSGLIQTQPYRGANGRLEGFRVEPGRNKALFQRYGLRPGDIVTSINGVTLTNAGNAFQILRGLSSRDDVHIELLRNGAPQSLDLHIQ